MPFRSIVLGAVVAAALAPSPAPAAPLPITGTLDLATDADLRIDGAVAGDKNVFTVANAGDVNGDGVTDLLLGADHADPQGRTDAGSAWVVFGPKGLAGNPIDLANLGSGGFRIDGALGGDEAGFSVASAGDVNGDGKADVIVGARLADPNPERKNAGAAYIVYGSASPDRVDLGALGDRGISIFGAAPDEEWGFALAGGADLNADGRGDLVIGAPRVDLPGKEGPAALDGGAAAVVFTPPKPGTVDLAALGGEGYRIDSAEQALAGWSVSFAPDLSGDKVPEVLIGGPFARSRSQERPGGFDGKVWVSYGKATIAPVDLGAMGPGGATIKGGPDGVAGGSVAPAGDMDGDGRSELLVGAQLRSTTERSQPGMVHVVSLRPGVTGVDLSKPGDDFFTVTGAQAGDQLGASVAGIGDYNGDGRNDFAAGAPFAGPLERRGAGAVYVVFGKEKNTDIDLALQGDHAVRIAGSAADEVIGRSIASLGDANGDGRSDIVISGFTGLTKKSTLGTAFVVLGPPPPPPPPPPLPPDPGVQEEVKLDRCRAASNVEAIIDDSGSMADTDAGNLRALALKLLLGKERNEGERIGAVEFGSDFGELFAPLTIGGAQFDAERDRLFSLIDERIQADSGGTDYNAGFTAALQQNAEAKAFIFLTDGAHNEGRFRNLHRKGPKTFVIGLGIGRKGRDAERLFQIAHDTGGRYYPSVDDDELQPVLNAIDSRLNCDIDLSTFQDVVTDDGDDEVYEEALGDGVHSGDVSLSWDDEDDDFDLDALVLEDRRGRALARVTRRSLRKAATGADVKVGGLTVSGRAGDTYESFRVTGLKRGRLRVKVRAVKIKGRGRERIVTQVTESRRRR